MATRATGYEGEGHGAARRCVRARRLLGGAALAACLVAHASPARAQDASAPQGAADASAPPGEPATPPTTSPANGEATDPAHQAEAAISRGVALRQRGEDEAALAEFRRAYGLSPSPRARAQIALALQALGHWVEADAEMAAALRNADDPWITRNREVLEAAAATIAQHLARLQVVANVPGATLWVNNQQVATLPMAAPLRVAIGTARVEVRAPGYVVSRRTIELLPDSTYREAFELLPAQSDNDDGGGGSGRGAGGAGAARPRGNPTLIAAGIVTMAGGAAFAGAGGAAHAFWQSRVALYNTDAQCLFGELTRAQRCGGVLADANTGEALAIAGYVVGGAALVAGAVVTIVGATAERPAAQRRAPARRAFACGGGPGLIGAACGGWF